jgi:hypothetical protein
MQVHMPLSFVNNLWTNDSDIVIGEASNDEMYQTPLAAVKPLVRFILSV